MLCVSKNTLHGSLRGGLHDLLDVIVFGLYRKKRVCLYCNRKMENAEVVKVSVEVKCRYYHYNYYIDSY